MINPKPWKISAYINFVKYGKFNPYFKIPFLYFPDDMFSNR